MIQSHRDLIVWQKAVQLIVECYRVTKQFPADERFGLTQQLRRAAVSVAANIAEGKGRGATQDFCRFLAIANGSLTELDTHFFVARELGYIKTDAVKDVDSKIEEVGRMLTALRKSLLRKKSPER
jgi:four helix bundle protein